ncbi:hypothetical protein [Streptomyces sp. AK02-04a]|uniref:hypothetical protein n=1 Tax=Streptomyces sp. AK02-04a TaxID=3028649 RepID=UPI0029BE0140|nr:hypothetical protein [Streptomyces sp. AK02-04a]MDX3762630.1 hypothetical protein [Streptomyces sp. AK02-04a]
MKLHARTRAGATALALAVAASGLTMAITGPAAAASCGKSQLGPTRYIWSGGHTIGYFSLDWNSCDGTAYTEARITNTNWTGSHGYINVFNSSKGSFALGPTSPTIVFDGTAWWDSGFLPINSYPSSDRNYLGDVQFTDSHGNAICTGYTPTWNFSGSGVQNQGSDMYC